VTPPKPAPRVLRSTLAAWRRGKPAAVTRARVNAQTCRGPAPPSCPATASLRELRALSDPSEQAMLGKESTFSTTAPRWLAISVLRTTMCWGDGPWEGSLPPGCSARSAAPASCPVSFGSGGRCRSQRARYAQAKSRARRPAVAGMPQLLAKRPREAPAALLLLMLHAFCSRWAACSRVDPRVTFNPGHALPTLPNGERCSPAATHRRATCTTRRGSAVQNH
jgi:hypothetical protein